MPLIRFKQWPYCSPIAPHAARCAATGNRYYWDGSQEGILNIPIRADVDELLNPLGDVQSEYEVAWEKYGVYFCSHGTQQNGTPPKCCLSAEQIAKAELDALVPVTVPAEPEEQGVAERRVPGRPRKRG